MSAAHRTHFLCNTVPPPPLQHLPLPPLLLSALATGADNWPVSLGKGVRHALFGLSSSVRLKLPSHPVAAAEAGRGSGRWGRREVHCNCFSDWYSVPSIHTRSVVRYVYAALQQEQPKQQLSYHTVAPPPPSHSCCYSCSCSSWT